MTANEQPAMNEREVLMLVMRRFAQALARSPIWNMEHIDKLLPFFAEWLHADKIEKEWVRFLPSVAGQSMQTYSFEREDGTLLQFDVDTAWSKAVEHCDCVMLEMKPIYDEWDRWIAGHPVDEAYAMSDRCDPMEPLLGAELEDGTFLCLDGSHRIYKAHAMGLQLLPCFILPWELAEQCIWLWAPPGHNIGWREAE